MKIAIYWIGKEYGGVEEILKNIIKFWPKKSDKFYLFTNVKTNLGYKRLKKKFLFKNVFNVLPDWGKKDLLIFKIIRYFFFPFFFKKFQKDTYREIFSTKIKFDVLIVNNGGYPGSWKSMSSLKSAIELGIKKNFLLIHHGSVHDKYILRTGEKYFDKKIQDWSSKIITISKATRDSMIKTRNFISKKFIVIHNGISLSDKKIKIKKNESKEKTVYLGILGRIEKYKGHEDILKALSIFNRQKKFKIKLLIAGKFISSFEKKRIMNLIEMYKIKKDVKFLGYIPEKKLNYFYSKLNLFFSITKDFEGFGLTILEAMSRKIPVVCTNVGGVSEFADKNSVTFVKPNDYRAIYNTIKRYLKDPNYFKQKTNLAIKITKQFTAQKMAKNYYEEIRKSY